MIWVRRALAGVLAAAMIGTVSAANVDAASVLRSCSASRLSGSAAQPPVVGVTARRPPLGGVWAGTPGRPQGLQVALVPSATVAGTDRACSTPAAVAAASLPSSPAHVVSGRDPPVLAFSAEI